MAIIDNLNRIQEEKLKLYSQEQILIEKRKREVADLAYQYGLLKMSDEEIKSAFSAISCKTPYL